MGIFHRKFASQGAAPGEISASVEGVEPIVSVMVFDGETLEEAEYQDLGSVPSLDGLLERPSQVAWVDVKGLGDPQAVRELALRFGLHPLAVSDVIHTGQRPKVDRYDGGQFVVLRMMLLAEAQLLVEQVSVLFGGSLVLSFQETHEDCLGPLRERIRLGRKQIRCGGADYLGTMVVDAIVDGYFPVLEAYGDVLEGFEDEILVGEAGNPLSRLYAVKRDLSGIRRATWPLRDALHRLSNDGRSELSELAVLHLRDTLDHVMQVVDVTESYRELSSSLVDVHLSLVGQRTNEIMRVLTVVSAIFIPLTFVAGIYGMNFDRASTSSIPELSFQHGYLYFWGLCVAIVLGMIVLFWRIGWIGSRAGRSIYLSR